jgi:hypothetical protein
MTMDLTESIIPRSDQINADDLIAGPITYTVREVVKGAAEQPFDFLLVETDRAYRPSKTMRRVIVGAWGPEAANYAGRRLTLYREPSIKYGGQTVGGIRISHMSHISGPVEVMAQTARGKRETFTVQPIEAGPTTGGGGVSAAGASESEASTPQESLQGAVNRQIREIQVEDGGGAFLSTWAADVGVKASSAAIAEKFGEAARDLRGLMGQEA